MPQTLVKRPSPFSKTFFQLGRQKNRDPWPAGIGYYIILTVLPKLNEYPIASRAESELYDSDIHKLAEHNI